MKKKSINNVKNSPSRNSPKKIIPDKQEYGFIRTFLLHQIKAGTPFIVKLQSYNSRFLDIYCLLSSFLGEKYAYITILPCFFWIGDEDLGIKFTFLTLIGSYLFNVLKMVLALPRPPSPPVLIKQHKMEDFGFPSAHCANSITVPFYLLHYCYGRGYFDNVYWFAFCIFLGLFWTFSITFSRLYLGVHSPTDLMGGAILGITFLYGWLQFQDEFVVWLKASPFVPFVLALILFITISTHPSSTIPTLTFKHAVQMISVATGSAIGVWFRYNYPSYWSSVITLPESWKFNPSLLVHLDQYFGPQSTITITKLLLGFIALGVVKTLNQIFFNFFFSFTFKLPFISSFLHLSNRILSVLTIPHLKAANNLDYPNSNWSQLEEKMQEFQKKRKHEKEARDYDAFVMSLIISNFLSGWVITDFTRELFFITGLSSQL